MSSSNNFFKKIFSRSYPSHPTPANNDDLDKKLVFGLLKHRVPNPKQLKYLPRFLNHTEKWIFRGALAILIIGLVWWIAHFWLYGLKQYPQAGGTYTEGLVGQPRLINPILAPLNSTDFDISRLIFRSLLSYGPDQQLHPDLAESYEISSDGKTYTFYLRRDIIWQDGEQFDAEDVIFTINAIKNPYLQSPYLSSFNSITAQSIDPYTIKFNLNEPYPSFIFALTVEILPEHIWNKIPDNQFALTEYNLKPIGNGPFKFKSLTKDKMGFIKSYSLERNTNFSGQTTYLDGINFKFFTSSDEAAASLKSKNVDGLFYSSSDWQEKIGNSRGIKRQPIYLPQYTALFFNQTKNTLLSSYNFRFALALSTDRQKIIDSILGGQGEMIQSPIAKGLPEFNNQLPSYDFSLERAKAILDKLGWKINPEDNFRYKSGQILTLTITTADKIEYLKVSELLKTDWTKLGIKVEINPQPTDNFQRDILRPHDYEILLYSVISGLDPDPYPIWHSSQIDNGLNLALYRNTKADSLLKTARSQPDTAKRVSSYQDFQSLLQDDLPAIFLYNPTHSYFMDKNLRGFEFKNLSIPQDRFNGAQYWHLKVKRSLK